MHAFRHRWLVYSFILFVFLGGCGGPGRAVLPPVDNPDWESRPGGRIVEVGDFVLITTVSGEQHLGEVKHVSSGSITVGRTGNFGYEESTVLSPEIEKIELNGGDSSGKAAAVIGIAILAVPVLLVVGFLIDPPNYN